MNDQERSEFLKRLEQFIRSETKGKPFVLSLVLLDRVAEKEGESNQTSSFIASYPNFVVIPYAKGRILLEVLGNSTLEFIQGMSINLQRVVRERAEPPKKEFA